MTLTDEHRLLQETSVRLFADKGAVSHLRALRDQHDPRGYDEPLWAAMAASGLTGLLVPEAYGGTAIGWVGAGLVAREIGRNLSLTPFLSTAVLGATALGTGGSEAQKKIWLPRIASGEGLVALAVDEGPHHRPENLRLAVSQGTVTGEKTFVLDGHVADLLLVAAYDAGATALYAVDAHAMGVTVERTILVDSCNAARIRFDHVPAAPLADGRAALDAALRAGRAVLAAELVGVAAEVFRRTVDYLKQRKQFGQLIGSLQGLQHRAAQLYGETVMADALAFAALDACDRAAPNAEALVYAAKAKAARVALQAGQEAIQMHGGIGMTDDFDIGFFIKRARGAGASLGEVNYCADRFAALGGY